MAHIFRCECMYSLLGVGWEGFPGDAQENCSQLGWQFNDRTRGFAVAQTCGTGDQSGDAWGPPGLYSVMFGGAHASED